LATFKLTVAYDGTGLVGWQRQAAGTSVQALLEDAFAELDGRAVIVTGAGRTDAGVHALGQVASVTLARDIDPPTLMRAINIRLPQAVRIVSAADAPPSFHARFDARRKSYRYRIWNAEVMNPFERAYAWHVPAPALDVGAMREAARHLEGVHDFTTFQGAGSDVQTSQRTILQSSIDAVHELITYDVTGDGFLRHMVRNIVGTLVEVGRGRQRPEWVRDLLLAHDRHAAGRTAPPEGLFLLRVDYD